MIEPIKDTNEIYHSKKDFISSSDMAGIRTLKEFYYKKFVAEKVQKDYFDIGTAAHAYILEPELFHNEIICISNGCFPEPEKLNKDGSICKKGKNGAYLKLQKEAFPGKIIFEQFWYKQVIKFAKALKQFPDFDKLFDLETGLAEMSYYGQCNEKGLKIKLRPDYVKPSNFIGDLKFCRSVDNNSLYRDFADHEYHVRAAFILDFYNEFTGDNIEKFLFAFAEKKEPYHVRIMELSPRDLAVGREVYKERLESIKWGFDNNKWPGFEKETGAESIETLVLPEWVYNKNNNF